jgi:hypothetical protein
MGKPCLSLPPEILKICVKGKTDGSDKRMQRNDDWYTNKTTYIAGKLLAEVLTVDLLRDSLLVQSAPVHNNIQNQQHVNSTLWIDRSSHLQLLLIVDVDVLLVAGGGVSNIDLNELQRQKGQHTVQKACKHHSAVPS